MGKMYCKLGDHCRTSMGLLWAFCGGNLTTKSLYITHYSRTIHAQYTDNRRTIHALFVSLSYRSSERLVIDREEKLTPQVINDLQGENVNSKTNYINR